MVIGILNVIKGLSIHSIHVTTINKRSKFLLCKRIISYNNHIKNIHINNNSQHYNRLNTKKYTEKVNSNEQKYNLRSINKY